MERIYYKDEKKNKFIERNNVFASNSEGIFFQIKGDESGLYVDLVDHQGEACQGDECEIKSPVTSEILEVLSEIEEEDIFNISWDKMGNKTYIDEHQDIFELLSKSPYVVDEKMEPLKINLEKEGRYTLNVTKDEKGYRTDLILEIEGKKVKDFITLDRKRVVVDGIIYHTDDLGGKYLEIEDLNTYLGKLELEKFLTLIRKYYPSVEISYEDYKISTMEMKALTPEIIIEKISKDNSLYLKVGVTISTMDNDFISENNLKEVVVVNELEKIINICKLDEKSLAKDTGDILSTLTKLQRNIGVRDGYFLDETTLIIHEKLARAFVTKELLKLAGRYKIIGTGKLKKYKIKTVKPKLVTNFKHSIDFLEGEAVLDIEGEEFSILEVLSAYRKDSYIVLSDGSNALINESYIKKLERLFKKKEEKVKLSFFDLPIIDELIEDKVYSGELNKVREVYMGINNLKEDSKELIPVDANLRKYQKYGYKWLSYLLENKLGGCLADDMGLGKTLQAIAVLSKVYEGKGKKDATLIVMPKSLVYNWDSEIKRFAPNLKVGIYYGSTRDTEIFKDNHIILSTYGTVRNDIEKLKEIKLEIIVLDESQNIKNINSQTTKAVMLLNSRKRIALSGTPVENNLGELYSLFRFLNPSMLGTVEEFNTIYANPIQKTNDSELIEELKKKIYPFILRRTKKEVLKDLPEKIEKVLHLEMNSDQKKLYEERRRFFYELVNSKIKEEGIGKSQVFILQALNELRQIASCPENKSEGRRITSIKREVLLEQIKDAVSNNHKILVFTNFIKSIDNICEDLKKSNIKYISMTGGTKDRQELVNKFQNDKECKVFVMTLKTGGVGLNLTAADTIFIYDPWWNKTAEDQAVDRSHRMGQDRTVFSYKLIARGTIEEKILKLQGQKKMLFDALISSDSANIKVLNEDDIEYILGE